MKRTMGAVLNLTSSATGRPRGISRLPNECPCRCCERHECSCACSACFSRPSAKERTLIGTTHSSLFIEIGKHHQRILHNLNSLRIWADNTNHTCHICPRRNSMTLGFTTPQLKEAVTHCRNATATEGSTRNLKDSIQDDLNRSQE